MTACAQLPFTPHARRPGCPPLAAANNKDGFLYVWDRNDLAEGPIFETPVGNPPQPFVGSPSWSSRLGMLFDAGAKVLLPQQKPAGGVTGFRVASGCVFQPVWRAVVPRGTAPPPIAVGNLVVTADYAGVVRVFAPPTLRPSS